MVVKSHGARRRTREKYRGPAKLTVNRALAQFAPGQTVAIVVSSNQQKGAPFRRFHGRTGRVLEQRGRAWIVEIRDGDSSKQVIARPEHLRAL